MFLGDYVPASDDLYAYTANSGFPVGWNASHELYPLREQLQWLGLAKRKVANTGDGETNYFGYAPGGFILNPRAIPGGTAAAQLPNYFTYMLPQMAFVAPTLALGAMHFWFNDQVQRIKPVAHDVWGVPPIRFLMADATVITRANADFLGPYNMSDISTLLGMSDNGFFDYTGASPATDAEMPFVDLATHPDALDCWMIDRQGRAFEISVDPKGLFHGHPDGVAFVPRWTCEREVSMATGDSGAVIVTVIDDVVHWVGHIHGAQSSSGPPAAGNIQAACNASYPALAYFDSLGATLTRTKRAIDYAPAAETVNQEILALLGA